MTVCMTPRARASDSALETRIAGFQTGAGFNHCPHEANITSRAPYDYKPIELTPEQLALL